MRRKRKTTTNYGKSNTLRIPLLPDVDMYRPPLTLPAARRLPSLLDAIEYHLVEVVEGADVFVHVLPPIMIKKNNNRIDKSLLMLLILT